MISHHRKSACFVITALVIAILACTSYGSEPANSSTSFEEPYDVAIAVENTFKPEQSQIERLIASFENDYPEIRVRPTLSYYAPDELGAIIRSGERDFNVVIARVAVMSELDGQGAFGVGLSANKAYNVSALSGLNVCVVSRRESYIEVPDLQYESGGEFPDENRIADYSEFEGTIAIPSSDNSCGVIANQLLNKLELYSNKSGIGGNYAPGFKEKVTVAENERKALDLVDDGICDIAFVWNCSFFGNQYDIVGKLDYGNNISLDCQARAISDDEDDTQALWFVEHIGNNLAS